MRYRDFSLRDFVGNPDVKLS